MLVTGKPRALAARVWIMALKPMSTLPEPMISVTSVVTLRQLLPLWEEETTEKRRTGRIVRLQKSNLDILLGEESLLLRKEDGCVVRRRVPSVFPIISIIN